MPMRATPPPAISCFMPCDQAKRVVPMGGLRTGVIVAVTLQQVDGTPDAKTGTERHNESLQYTDCTVEKCHTGLLKSSPAGVE